MFDIFNFARKRRLSFASEALQAPSEASKFGLVQLQTLQMVAQQVVLSLEGSIKIPGAAKKALALKLMGELLEEIGIVAPDSLIDTAIEASVKILKALESESQAPPMPKAPPVPSFKLDISGRPSSGNSERGLSL